MTNSIKYILVLLILCANMLSIKGQTLRSLYFLENNNQRHNLNPAFQTNSNYVNFPALGNIYISANSNVGLGAFMTPKGDEMVTFLHNSISAEDAMSKFKSKNIIESNNGINLLGFGFNKWGGTNSFAINVRSMTGAYLPKTIFSFLKEGQTSDITEYNVSDVKVTTLNYCEVAIGHARNISEKVSIGGKLKFLYGAAYAQGNIDNMRIYMSGDKWIINQNSSFVSSKGLSLLTDADGEINDIELENSGMPGLGGALDLGLVYNINKNWSISFAVTDLGFINWKECSTGVNRNTEFEYNGFDNIGVEDDADGNNSFDDAADDVWDSLKGLVKYYDDGKKSSTNLLYTTLRFGAEYKILQNKISFGLLSSVRLGAPELWNETMLSVNLKPAKWFSASINGSYSNIRSSMGATINFCPRAVNFFVGMDYFLVTYSKQLIPIDAAKINIGTGLSFNF